MEFCSTELFHYPGTLNVNSDAVVTKRLKTLESEFSEILFVQNDLRSINGFINTQSNEFSDLLTSTLEIYSLPLLLSWNDS